MQLHWFGLLCDVTLVLLVAVLAVPYNIKVNEAVDFNQAMFDTGLCNSRGVWNASEHYRVGDCVLLPENNCIYLRHDDSTESRHSAAAENHKWIPGGPSLKHFAPSVCVPRDLPPVQLHEIPLYIHLIPLYEAVVFYCNTPDRNYELQDWLAKLFYKWQDPNHMCIVEMLGTLALPKSMELLHDDMPSNDRNLFITHFMMRSNQCTKVSNDFLSSVQVLLYTVVIRSNLIACFLLIYTTTWIAFARPTNQLSVVFVNPIRLVLLMVCFHLFQSFLLGYPQIKLSNAYNSICPSLSLFAKVGSITSILFLFATIAVSLLSSCKLSKRPIIFESTGAVRSSSASSAAKTPAVSKANVNVKEKKDKKEKKKTK